MMMIICTWHLTLYVPRLLTTHGSEASLPNDTVTFGIGSAKLGSSVNTAKKKSTKNVNNNNNNYITLLYLKINQ